MERLNTLGKAAVIPLYKRLCFEMAKRAISSARVSHANYDKIAVVAAYGRNNGISSGAKLQAENFATRGLQVVKLDVTKAIRNPTFRKDHHSQTTYIFHCGGPQTPNLILGTAPYSKDAYRIAYWAWELPAPPKGWPRPGLLVNEIWTPSTFSKKSLMQVSDVPIRVIPHNVVIQPERLGRISSTFTVLSMADSRSSFDRKNVAGVVTAFRSAFGSRDDALLILKLSGSKNLEVDFGSQLSRLITNSANIRVIHSFLSAAEINSLYDSADVLLSLHRAEGFGLPMLEAMARGIPVLATGWSGNTDFMDEENAISVPYRMVPIRDRFQYKAYTDGYWADPDLDFAANSLRRLASDTDLRARLGRAGRAAVARLNEVWPSECPLELTHRFQRRSVTLALS